jgi:hypothetical protein
LSSKVYYRNAIVFVGVLFLLTGLQESGRPPILIWWQLAVMYFGAGLNKLLEVDWRTGQYFDHFLGHMYGSPVYTSLAPLFPGHLLAAAMCWWIILAELTAGVLFLFRRYHRIAVWFAASVHVGAAVLVVGDFGIFLAAVLASYLALAPWPERLDVTSADSAFARAGKRLCDGLGQRDFIHWRIDPATSGFSLAQTGVTYTGWPSRLRLLLACPLTYFVVVTSLTAPSGSWRSVAVTGWGVVGMAILTAVAIRWALRFKAHGGANPALSDGA